MFLSSKLDADTDALRESITVLKSVIYGESLLQVVSSKNSFQKNVTMGLSAASIRLAAKVGKIDLRIITCYMQTAS